MSAKEKEIIQALESALKSAHRYLKTSGFDMKSIDAALSMAEKHESSPTPRVLVVVSGGVADPIYDPGVDVEVFDWDNYKDDPENTVRPPAHFADLAGQCDVPVAEDVQASRCRMGRV